MSALKKNENDVNVGVDDPIKKRSIMNNNKDDQTKGNNEDMISNKPVDISSPSLISISDMNMNHSNNSSHFKITDDHEKTQQQSYVSISDVTTSFNNSIYTIPINNHDNTLPSFAVAAVTDASIMKKKHKKTLSNHDRHINIESLLFSISMDDADADSDDERPNNLQKETSKLPPHKVTASIAVTDTSIRKMKNISSIHLDLEHGINNDINLHNMNNIQNNNDNSGGPDYKDQVGLQSACNSQNYQVPGGVAELVERNDNVVVDDQNTTISSSLSNQMIQPSAITNIIPEQEQQQNLDEDHPVVAEAYKVSSLIVEAQPLRRNNRFMIIFVIVIFVMMIAGILLGVICQNGSCSSNSSAPTSSNNNSTYTSTDAPSSAPTSKRQPILDSYMLRKLIRQYIDGTFNYEDDSDTTIEQFGMIKYWDVSDITEFSYLFSTYNNPEMVSFNVDISRWDVKNAIEMIFMFNGAASFNGNLSLWDVSKVKSFAYMFYEAKNFHGIGLEYWLLNPLVDDLLYMFNGATLFDANLSHWDVSGVIAMKKTFADAQKFSGIGLENWNTSQLFDTTSMFAAAILFVGDLSRWDVSKIKYMNEMFTYASSFNSNLSEWNVSNVVNMSHMFKGTEVFHGSGLSNWDVSKVEDMPYMFEDARSFDADLSNWNVTLVSSMSHMFSGAEVFNSDFSRWDISNVNYLEAMFSGASSFTGIGLSNWNVGKVKNINYLFTKANQLDADLSMWDVSRVTTMQSTFSQALNVTGFILGWEYLFSLTSFNGSGLSEWNVSNVMYFNDTFKGSSIDVDLSNWDVRSAISTIYMFAYTQKFDSNLSGWNVKSIKDFTSMFAGATSFRGIGLENWILNDNAVLDGMFCGADSFDPKYISKWNITSNVYCDE